MCRHECWPHPGVGSSRRCCRRGGRSGGYSRGTVRGDPARCPGRGLVDPGAGRSTSGASAHGAAGVGLARCRHRGSRIRRVECPAIGPWTEVIDGWLIEDKDAPRKQRHTARRVWQRLVAEHGATCAEVTVSSVRRAAPGRARASLTWRSRSRRPTRRARRPRSTSASSTLRSAGSRMKLWMFVMRLSALGQGVPRRVRHPGPGGVPGRPCAGVRALRWGPGPGPLRQPEAGGGPGAARAGTGPRRNGSSRCGRHYGFDVVLLPTRRRGRAREGRGGG